MKINYIPFFFLLISLLTFGQQDPFVEMWSEKQIDSLKNEWKNSHTNRYCLYFRYRSLSWPLPGVPKSLKPKSSLLSSFLQPDLAKKLKLKLWEVDAYDQEVGWAR